MEGARAAGFAIAQHTTTTDATTDTIPFPGSEDRRNDETRFSDYTAEV
jgi:hypothetical protein